MNPHDYMMAGKCKVCGKVKSVKDALDWAKGSWTGGGISKCEVCMDCDKEKK